MWQQWRISHVCVVMTTDMRVLHVLIHVAKVVLPSYNVFKVRVSGCNWQLTKLNTVQTQPTVYMALYLSGATSGTNAYSSDAK